MLHNDRPASRFRSPPACPSGLSQETCRRKPEARSCRLGQAWAIDFVVGIIVLLFILANFMLMWDTLAVRWGAADAHMKMKASAYFASESLMATAGEPESWEMLPHIDGNVSAVGLVNGRNELNRMKLEKLAAENATAYGTVRNRLGLQRYEFGMRVTDLAGNAVLYEFGTFSAGSLNNSLSFDRLGILDGSPVIVHLEVWGA